MAYKLKHILELQKGLKKQVPQLKVEAQTEIIY